MIDVVQQARERAETLRLYARDGLSRSTDDADLLDALADAVEAADYLRDLAMKHAETLTKQREREAAVIEAARELTLDPNMQRLRDNWAFNEDAFDALAAALAEDRVLAHGTDPPAVTPCPYCRSRGRVVPECQMCNGAGWVAAVEAGTETPTNFVGGAPYVPPYVITVRSGGRTRAVDAGSESTVEAGTETPGLKPNPRETYTMWKPTDDIGSESTACPGDE